eukprot:GFUD01029122.1.p1 GENE.GFUD01029122.1~~GFUD01029122.1.p1  ORF type:complete len:451 (-),score=102.42 GFUD01029122.1:49-1401(-)
MQVMFFSLWIVLSLACLGLCMPQGEQQENLCTHYAPGYLCVAYYQCNAKNEIITDGADLFDPRQAFDEEPEINHEEAVISKCGKLLEVCCRFPNSTAKPKDTTNNEENVDDNIFGTYDEDIFGTNDDNIFGPPQCDDDDPRSCPIPVLPGQCGNRNNEGLDQGSDLESSVDEAKFGEWPHICAVLKKEYIGEAEQLVKIYQCGASLIADGVVLTAGHCVNDTEPLDNNLVVRCGEWDTQSEDEILPFEEQDVDRLEMHPKFNVDNHHNNFALLFLRSSFRASSHISPVCLPRPGVVFGQQNCVSHGWGKDKFGAEGRYSTILKEVVVPLVENDKCQKLLRENTRLGPFFELDSSFLCAGGQKDIDTCKGDGGSPLTCRHQPGERWFQAGIVSWGIGCGENNTPAVYANVAEASCWIDNAVKKHFGQSDSYFGFAEEDCEKDPVNSDIFDI